MGPLGWQETIVIFVVALLIFGPKKLPELGKNLAKALGEFKRASNELKSTWDREMSAIEQEGRELKKTATQYTSEIQDSYTPETDEYNYGYDYDYSDSHSSSSSSTDSASATQGADANTGSGTDSKKAPEGTIASGDPVTAHSANGQGSGAAEEASAAAEGSKPGPPAVST